VIKKQQKEEYDRALCCFRPYVAHVEKEEQYIDATWCLKQQTNKQTLLQTYRFAQGHPAGDVRFSILLEA
jgi:hypothetical protein